MSESFLKDILISLSEEKIQFIIFGGVAVVLHGVERMTLDLDISISREEDNLKKFLQVMKKFNLTPRAPIPEGTLLNPELIDLIIKEKNAIAFTFIDKEKPFKQVDVLIHPDLAYERWIHKTDTVELFGHKICILSREAIIELKEKLEKPRDKDIMDIKELKNSTQNPKKEVR
ncbi:MAG: hypothetical protein ACK4UJ_07285 [Leptonema sp. (in: bacteria)]